MPIASGTHQDSGRLTCLAGLKKVGDLKYGYFLFCLCDCGNYCIVRAADFKRNHTRSCGCLQKEKTAAAKTLNLTGQRFGRLTALEPLNKRGGSSVIWKCQCDCGNICEVQTNNLNSGNTKSCGCLSREKAAENVAKAGRSCALDLTNKILPTGSTILSQTEERDRSGSVIWNCKCGLCGKFYRASAGELNASRHMICPNCASKETKGEAIIKQILVQNNIKFLQEYTFEDLPRKRFDFYLPDLNVCIEFDGVQHFKPVEYWGGEETFLKIRKRDEGKNKYCLNNNIKLYRIPYNKLNNITHLQNLLSNNFLISNK